MPNRIHVYSNWVYRYGSATGNAYSAYTYIDLPTNFDYSNIPLSFYKPSDTLSDNSPIYVLPNGNWAKKNWGGSPSPLGVECDELRFANEYGYANPELLIAQKFTDSGILAVYDYNVGWTYPTYNYAYYQIWAGLAQYSNNTALYSQLISFTANLERDAEAYYQEPVLADYYNGYWLETEPLICKVKIDFVPTETKTINLKYYQYSNETQIDPDGGSCKTYGYHVKKLELIKGERYRNRLEFVPCSLISSDFSLFGLLQDDGNFFGKDWASINKLSDLRARWLSLLDNKIAQDNPQGVLTTIQGMNHRIAANNNIWNNGAPESDINPNIGSIPSQQWLYEKYLRPNTDNTYGTYIMPDSPRLMEIHNALDAAYWGNNDLDPDKLRVDNLGWRIRRGNEVAGIRVDEEGKVNKNTEKKNVRSYVKSNQKIDEKEYGGNCYGTKGMLVRNLPNNIEKGVTKDGGVVKIHDSNQLILHLIDTLNTAIGLQESANLKIRNGDEDYYYPNQLAMFTEMLLMLKNQSTYTRGAFISGLITQEQTKELIAGLGLPTINKTISVGINKKTKQIPYWGIAPQASIQREIRAVAYNVGIITGQLI
jgi:hypothetical protein